MFGKSINGIVNCQKDFDSIKDDFSGRIEIKNTTEPVSINRSFNNAYIVVSDNATIKSVYGNATIKYVSGNATIESVYDNATIKSVYGNATIKSVYGNATIESVYGNATIESVYDNATIEYVSGNATIEYVSGNATIESVYGNATIKSVYGNATIEYVSGNATIESVSGNATIESVSDNATIESVYGNATILLMTGLASIVLLYKAKKIVAKGMNLIRQIGTEKIDIVKRKSVTYVQIKKTIKEDTTFEMYSKLYPVQTKGKKVILYKAVHKKGDRYFADYNPNYEYKIGEVKTENCDDSNGNSCSYGIHLSHLHWAVLFGKGWDDMAIIECETNIKDIVVSKDCDGKLRTSKIKVLREVNKSEY